MVDRNPQTGSFRKSSEDQRYGDIWCLSVRANHITNSCCRSFGAGTASSPQSRALMVNQLRSRAELVEALIEHRESVGSLLGELRTYGWDSEDELITLRPRHILSVLHAFPSGRLNASHLREWANAIEQREDIGMLFGHQEVLDEMIFWLANPEINYSIDSELVARVISNLERNHVE